MDIKIKTKLRAYSKGILPTKVSDLENDLDFIPDAPKDGQIYARKDGSWKDISDINLDTIIALANRSGLNLEYDAEERTYTLGIRKEELTNLELPVILQDDTTYYVLDLDPNTFIDGGTAYSSGNNEFVEESEYTISFDGGNCHTNVPIKLFPTDCNDIGQLPLNENGFKIN